MLSAIPFKNPTKIGLDKKSASDRISDERENARIENIDGIETGKLRVCNGDGYRKGKGTRADLSPFIIKLTTPGAYRAACHSSVIKTKA
jgi:hypothetical protein